MVRRKACRSAGRRQSARGGRVTLKDQYRELLELRLAVVNAELEYLRRKPCPKPKPKKKSNNLPGRSRS